MTNTRSTRSGAHAPQAVDYSRCPEPAPFLKKTYEMVSDPELEKIISWSPDGESFTVWNHSDFENKVLPMKFKHQNFSSFVRQLNTYNFRKSDPTAWQFSNKHFKRGKPEELHLIKRKTKQSALDNTLVPGNAAIEVGSFGGIVDEVEALKRDKNVLMLELVRLRQQQQAAEAEIKQMRAKVEKTEQGQQQIMGFLTQAVNNPAFLHQLLNARQSNNRVTEEGRKKRRAVRPGDRADTSKAIITYQPQEEDFSTSFLNLLQREGHHSLERSANSLLPANGMEIEGLSDDDMNPPDVAGLNFDHLNLSSRQPVRSAVTINEHLPQDVPSLDDILQQPLQIPQSTALPPPSFPPGSLNTSDPFSPSNAAATDFGMPEILPTEQLSSADLLSPMGPPLTSASPNDFAYSTGMPAIPGTSPFASSSAQAEGGGQMLDMGPAPDFTLGDNSEVSQEIWKMLNGSSSLNGELPPWPQDMSGVSEGLPIFTSSGFNDDIQMPDNVQQAPVRAG
ncbi:g7598 [Coccomyxa elongata]